jgi:hypothetical protein
MGRLVTIAHFTYRHDGEFAQGFLTDAGIPSQLSVDDAGGHVMVTNQASLTVREEDAEEARRILEDAEIDFF